LALAAFRDDLVDGATPAANSVAADVLLRLAKSCRPVPGDPIVGYISLGKGITIHH